MSYSIIVTALLCWTALSVAAVAAWCVACEVAIRRHRRPTRVRRDVAAVRPRVLVAAGAPRDQLTGTRTDALLAAAPISGRPLREELFTDEELHAWMDGTAS